ncbi:MAG: hypothetical protein IJA85_12505 [Clostridia bacterium]|nr:hypothetical protein [Clostridia bacterium]
MVPQSPVTGGGKDPEKVKKVKRRPEYVIEEVSENPYYLAISRKYKYAKLFTVALLVIYLLFMISTRRDDITIENLRYMFKYIDVSPDGEEASLTELLYDSDSELTLELYRGDVVSATSKAVTIYDAGGSSVMTSEEAFDNPVIRSSEKYLMVYDLGGDHFSIYNSFTQLYTESFSFPISCADISDSSAFAVATRNLEYKTEVLFYDKNYKVVNRISKDKYAASLDLNPEGTELLLASFNVEGGDYYTEIMRLKAAETEPSLLFTISDTMPLEIAYTSDGGFSLLCDRGICYYDEKGVKRGEMIFSGLPADVYLGADYTVAVFNQNLVGYNNLVLVTDRSGNTVYRTYLKGQLVDIDVSGDDVFILLDGSVVKIALDSGHEISEAVEKNTLQVLAAGDGAAVICYSNKASVCTFREGTETETSEETN